jgi:hypothetical protein
MRGRYKPGTVLTTLVGRELDTASDGVFVTGSLQTYLAG